jgi:transcriptional regulator with XRE-family HTH domain
MASRQLGVSRRKPPRIGGPLRALLDERFISHAELAQAIGVHEGNISRWVRNATGPQKRQIRAIAEYFDVPPASLIEPGPDDDKVAA